jgi:hypothetical protein
MGARNARADNGRRRVFRRTHRHNTIIPRLRAIAQPSQQAVKLIRRPVVLLPRLGLSRKILGIFTCFRWAVRSSPLVRKNHPLPDQHLLTNGATVGFIHNLNMDGKGVRTIESSTSTKMANIFAESHAASGIRKQLPISIQTRYDYGAFREAMAVVGLVGARHGQGIGAYMFTNCSNMWLLRLQPLVTSRNIMVD